MDWPNSFVNVFRLCDTYVMVRDGIVMGYGYYAEKRNKDLEFKKC